MKEFLSVLKLHPFVAAPIFYLLHLSIYNVRFDNLVDFFLKFFIIKKKIYKAPGELGRR